MNYEFCKEMYGSDEDFKDFVDRYSLRFNGDVETSLHHLLVYETAQYYTEKKSHKS